MSLGRSRRNSGKTIKMDPKHGVRVCWLAQDTGPWLALVSPVINLVLL
jgi:hypothetical protein